MNDDEKKQLNSDIRAAIWMVLRARERPIHGLLAWCCDQPDAQKALGDMMLALEPGEAAALLPEIEAEKLRREAWFARKENADA